MRQKDDKLKEKKKMHCPPLKLKNFYISKDTIKKVKRLAIEWKSIFAVYMINEYFISRIHK